MFILLVILSLFTPDIDSVKTSDDRDAMVYFAKDFLKHNRRALNHSKRTRRDIVKILVLEHSDETEVCFLPRFPLQRLLITDADTLGSNRIPISYFELDGILFYWRDERAVMTQGTIDMFLKYQFLEFVEGPPELFIGENEVYYDGAYVPHYYYKGNDYLHFRRKAEWGFRRFWEKLKKYP